MIITDSSLLRDLQADFNLQFPYLKIEFYQGQHQAHEASAPNSRIETDHSVAIARESHQDGEFNINEGMTVNEVENLFYDYYGLNVQVFRRSGNIWLQTTSTDDWTLEEQNKKGRQSMSQG